MSEAVNYNKMSNEKLLELITERSIDIPDLDPSNPNRKLMTDSLRNWDSTTGVKPTDGLVSEDHNRIVMMIKGKKVTFLKVIFSNVDESDVPYVYCGHNGKSYYYEREKELWVPDYILNSCIKDAVIEKLLPVRTDRGNIDWKVKKVPRFPYTLVQ